MSQRSQHQAEIDALKEQLAQITARLSQLERPDEPVAPVVPPGTPGATPEEGPREAEAPALPDDVVAVIGAAVAAFLGERARVRQIRLISSPMWAQQGRVAIQASHRLTR